MLTCRAVRDVILVQHFFVGHFNSDHFNFDGDSFDFGADPLACCIQ
jgi:hypothetical protein